MNPQSPPPRPSGHHGQTPPPPTDYNQPVAWDQYGRPLYARPPEQQANAHTIVQVSRPVDPVNLPITPETMRKHEESLRKYPGLNLSKGEFIIAAVRRHPIGVVQIWLVVASLIIAFGALFGMLFLGEAADSMSLFGDGDAFMNGAALGLFALFALILLGGFAATYIYNNNRFYLTNESVIQEIQTTLFNRHEQTVSLANIEDASFRQAGVFQTILNYGTIRLSTEGDETTYRFSYVANPKRHIATLNNAVEAFKNGRPVVND